ncbi:MAG: hypothetical protein V1695_03780, partial [Candidatus Uhrbacteria bacterium]
IGGLIDHFSEKNQLFTKKGSPIRFFACDIDFKKCLLCRFCIINKIKLIFYSSYFQYSIIHNVTAKYFCLGTT